MRAFHRFRIVREDPRLHDHSCLFYGRMSKSEVHIDGIAQEFRPAFRVDHDETYRVPVAIACPVCFNRLVVAGKRNGRIERLAIDAEVNTVSAEAVFDRVRLVPAVQRDSLRL